MKLITAAILTTLSFGSQALACEEGKVLPTNQLFESLADDGYFPTYAGAVTNPNAVITRFEDENNNFIVTVSWPTNFSACSFISNKH